MRDHYDCDVEVNLCYSNPCKNNGECLQKEGGYVCKCKAGFMGWCHHQILIASVIYLFLIQNVSLSNFFFLILALHAGKFCEIQEETRTCKSHGDWCSGESTCAPSTHSGIMCQNCPLNAHYNERCELRARTFSQGSFLTFPGLRNRYRLDIQLRYIFLFHCDKSYPI